MIDDLSDDARGRLLAAFHDAGFETVKVSHVEYELEDLISERTFKALRLYEELEKVCLGADVETKLHTTLEEAGIEVASSKPADLAVALRDLSMSEETASAVEFYNGLADYFGPEPIDGLGLALWQAKLGPLNATQDTVLEVLSHLRG
jgi:hypothetical protein